KPSPGKVFGRPPPTRFACTHTRPARSGRVASTPESTTAIVGVVVRPGAASGCCHHQVTLVAAGQTCFEAQRGVTETLLDPTVPLGGAFDGGVTTIGTFGVIASSPFRPRRRWICAPVRSAAMPSTDENSSL